AANHRPVHRRGSRQVGAGFIDRVAAAARVRGPGSGALERASGEISAAVRGGQPARCKSVDARAVLPHSAAPGAVVRASPTYSDAAEESAASAGSGVEAHGASHWKLPPGDRGSGVGAGRAEEPG